MVKELLQSEVFLAAVDESGPSGKDLRNDPRFHAIERLLEPASRQNRLAQGSAGVPAASPVDWAALLVAAETLAESGRDLRLLVIVVRAMANLDGYAGLARGLALLGQTVTQYWDSLHPMLRDRDDPREAALGRLNALKQLENDDNGLLGDLKLEVVLNPRGLGPVTGDDLAAAALSLFEAMNEAPAGLGKAEQAALSAAHEMRINRATAATRTLFAEDPDAAQALLAAVGQAQDGLTALQKAIGEQVGLGDAPGLGFPELGRFLARIGKTLEAAMAKTESPAVAAVQEAPSAPAMTSAAAPTIPATASEGIPNAITGRKDVERCLELIIDFYERTEPSSPIPHLARRMRRMVPMNFMELMNEIAPSGVKEFRSAAGVKDEKEA